MFVPYEPGTLFLLHVGQRLYPDGDRHLEIMQGGGLSDREIADLKSLPPGYTKGMAVAILEIGETYENHCSRTLGSGYATQDRSLRNR